MFQRMGQRKDCIAMTTSPKPWPVMSVPKAHAILTAPGARFEMDEVVIRGVKTRVWKNRRPPCATCCRLGRMYGARDFPRL
jgi:long-chain acyl-CoA synthetase